MNAQHNHASAKAVLVVEDDPSILLGLELNLKRAGYRVLLASDGDQGLALYEKERTDLILLDLMLPGVNGLEILRRIRAEQPQLPVIILTAMGAESDKIKGLDLGANDYVTKPFSIEELLARVRAAFRTANVGRSDEPEILRAGPIEVNTESRQVFASGDPVELKSREYAVLVFLMKRPERVLSRAQILSNVWGVDYEGTDRTVDNYVSALRKKLGEDSERPRHLRTVWGIGYRFVP